MPVCGYGRNEVDNYSLWDGHSFGKLIVVDYFYITTCV
jgi:hypothetical protein